MNFTSSSSLTIGERICVAFVPLFAVVEDLIMAIIKCCEYHPRRRRENCRRHHLDEVARLADETNFSANEVEALYELFKKLSSSIVDDGLIQKEELQLALLKTTCDKNFILDRVFDIFDEKKKGVLEFEEFVHALSVFHPHAPLQAKIDFAFRLFDIRETGYIDRVETFADVDEDNDGRINREEWEGFVLKHPSLLKHMTLPYLK